MKTATYITNIVLASLLVPLVTACNSDEHKEAGPKYQVTNPLKSDQNIVREYVAQVRAIQHIELRAFERGYLKTIFVDEGQLIKKGEKMFEVVPLLNKAEYQKAKAEMDLAEIEYKNTKSLADKNVVSQNELALGKAKFEKAKADLQLKKIHLDYTVVKAPFEGIMDKFRVRLGSLVEEGELLTTMSDNSRMWVYFNVAEADYLNLKSNKDQGNELPVQLRMANGKIFDQPGKIDTVEADFNNETGNIAFRASFDNPDRLLRHGETGNILVTVPYKGVLVIPQKATFDILDKKYVYVLDDQNKLKSREVKVEAELPHLFIISSGLTEQDKVLIDGVAKLQPGQKITPNFIEPQKAISELAVPAK
jgi:membrane fusion protein, multidrug efflux system